MLCWRKKMVQNKVCKCSVMELVFITEVDGFASSHVSPIVSHITSILLQHCHVIIRVTIVSKISDFCSQCPLT